jgi:hypothetical protein
LRPGEDAFEDGRDRDRSSGRSGPTGGVCGATDGRTRRRAPAVAVTGATVFWYSLVAVSLVGWFLFGWLVLGQGIVDSAGEALGSGFAVLLIVSIVGTLRRSRRGRDG